MLLTAVEKRSIVDRKAKLLLRFLKNGSSKYFHRVGWPHGSKFKNVFWRHAEKYWFTYERMAGRSKKYWFAFGIENPEIKTPNSSLLITCEINPPFGGPTRKSAGLIATDKTGKYYLCHSGKIGGGKKGVGKKAFVRYAKDLRTARVKWSDGLEKNVFVLGQFDNSLTQKISEFVDRVADFKQKKTSSITERFYRGYFNPESSRSTVYERKGRIKPGKTHALVVNELARRLQLKNQNTENNKNIDLMITIKSGKVKEIYEIKTDNGTSSVYQGVGQLMFHSAREKKEPQKHLVLPVGLNRKSEQRLKMLGINLIYFRKHGQKVKFYNL